MIPAWKERARAVALGGAAGLCIGMAGAPREWCALAWLGPALLLLAISGARGELARPSIALLAGASCGVAANALTMSWILELLERYAGFPLAAQLPVGMLLWIGQSLPWAVAAWLAVAVARAGAVPAWIALPGAIAIAGAAAPMLFPWRLGVSQMAGVTYVQCAELGGPPLVDLLMALGACGAMEALRRTDARAAAVGAAAIVLPYAYGAWRVEAVRAERAVAPALSVGVVQPDLTIEERMNPMLREGQLAMHRRMTRELEDQGAELVLWPEASYPFWLDHDGAHEPVQRWRRVHADGARGPVLFGAITLQGDEHFNSVVAMAEDGRVTGVYDKVNLLAFGEYVPLWDFLPPLQRFFRRGLTPGACEALVPIAGTTAGPLNCYEDLLVEHARRTAALDPGFLANFTNDAWFGDTAAPWLHHMLARMRAVETRRDLVRAVNTGVSALVTATGEDEHRTRPFERTSFVAEVRVLHGPTPWVRFGDLVTPALMGLFAGAVLARRKAR